ncbi:unnamed protein product [Musa hybrid cultivar]
MTETGIMKIRESPRKSVIRKFENVGGNRHYSFCHYYYYWHCRVPRLPPPVGRRCAAIDHYSVDRLKDEVGAFQGFRVFSSPGAAQRSIVPVPAASKMKWESSKGSGVAPDRSSRAPRAVSWSLRPILSRGPPWTISCPGSKPWSRGSDIILHRCLSSNPPNGSLLDKRQWMRETKRGWEGAWWLAGGSPARILISGIHSLLKCYSFCYDSEESDDDLTIGRTTCLLDKEDLDKSILFMLEQENQLRVKEELRCKLAKLEVAQRNEMNRFASAISQIDKYVEDRQEMDRRFDQQYRRKIAEVVDSHLSAVRRDHEKRSQIEERRIRDDAALEEAKKKAILEEKLRQEKAKTEAEAKLRAAKLAEEAERVALEAAQRAAAEAAESKAAASEDTKKKSMDHNEEETKERGSGSEVPKEVQLTTGCPTPKVLAVDAALRAEASRQKIYNEVAEKSNLIASKEFDRCGRQIYKNLKQITGTVENVRAKTHALIDLLNNPVCPSSISVFLFAKKVVSLCEDPTGTFDSTAFACGQVILLVSSQVVTGLSFAKIYIYFSYYCGCIHNTPLYTSTVYVPAVMDFVLAEFHKSCIYTVPKYLQPSDQTLQTKDYWKMVGYHEVDGKIESSENYLNRVQSYMKLYAAIVQTEIEGVRNPHGLAEGWAWLARFLNALPANRSTAYALEAFLKMAGFALHRRYKSQFKKVLNAISRSFLPALRERGDRKLNEIIKRLEQYLEDQVFLKEPEGWRLHSSLLSKELRLSGNVRMDATVGGEEEEMRQAKEMAAARRRWETLIREQKVKVLTPREAGYAIQLSNKTLLDVRPSTEHEKAWVRGSTWIPIFDVENTADIGTLSKKITNFVMGGWWSGSSMLVYDRDFLSKVEEKFPKESDLILVCQKGLRSLAACEQLYNAGFRNLFWVQGGLEAADEEDFPREGPQPFKLAGIGGVSEFLGWTDQQRAIGAREGWSYRLVFTGRLLGLILLADALFLGAQRLGPLLQEWRITRNLHTSM